MRNEKILVVDDDPAIRRLIWKSLQSTGILIYQSDSVEKTVDIMTRVKFDLFLLDISLEHENAILLRLYVKKIHLSRSFFSVARKMKKTSLLDWKWVEIIILPSHFCLTY